MDRARRAMEAARAHHEDYYEDHVAKCGNKKVWAVVSMLCLMGGGVMLMYAFSMGGCACAGSCIGLMDVACVDIMKGCGHELALAKKFKCNFSRFNLSPLKQKLKKAFSFNFGGGIIRRRRTPPLPPEQCPKEPPAWNGDCRGCLARRRSSKTGCTRRRRLFEGTANYWCQDTNKCSDKNGRDKNCKKSFDNSYIRNYFTNTVSNACGPARRTDPAKAPATASQPAKTPAASQQWADQAISIGAGNRRLLEKKRRVAGSKKIQTSVLSKVKGECKEECRYPGLTIPGFICLVFFGCLNLLIGLCALFGAVPCFCCAKRAEGADDMTTVIPMDNFKKSPSSRGTPPVPGFRKSPSPPRGARVTPQMSPNTMVQMPGPMGAPMQMMAPQQQMMGPTGFTPQMMVCEAPMMAGQQQMMMPDPMMQQQQMMMPDPMMQQQPQNLMSPGSVTQQPQMAPGMSAPTQMNY